MVKKVETGSAKRYGTRYGRMLKLKVAKLEEQYKKKLKCPYCHYDKVKRIASGIWKCNKCNSEFTASAYSISEKKIVEEETEQ